VERPHRARWQDAGETFRKGARMEQVVLILVLALPFVVIGALIAILIVVIGNQTAPKK
jgi:hypothetical protein